VNEPVCLAKQGGLCAFARTVRTHNDEFVHDLVFDGLQLAATQSDDYADIGS
jgi:hypothetical protein